MSWFIIINFLYVFGFLFWGVLVHSFTELHFTLVLEETWRLGRWWLSVAL